MKDFAIWELEMIGAIRVIENEGSGEGYLLNRRRKFGSGPSSVWGRSARELFDRARELRKGVSAKETSAVPGPEITHKRKTLV